MVLEIGEYVTRGGKRVTITTIAGNGTFPAKGYVWRMYRGKLCKRDWNGWKLDGSYMAVGEHGRDITHKAPISAL